MTYSARLILFIDDKNVYNGARRAFFSAFSPHYDGQINPLELGKLIWPRTSPNANPRFLHQVRVYTGRPDASRQPQVYAAHMKQCAVWKSLGVEVIPRVLRYPDDWPKSKAEQKGVDVALAIDFVTFAVEGAYDVGVIASTDTDLKPALEYVIRKCGGRCRVEVAAWRSPNSKSRLFIPNSTLWCHWLDRTDYDAVVDPFDYNL